MKCNLVLFSIFVLIGFRAQSQENYSVVAENGLIVRAQPSFDSPRLGKFLCGEPLKLLKKTDIQIEIPVDSQSIKGYWYYVISKSRVSPELKGYVFSAFLLKFNAPERTGMTCEENEIVCSIQIATKQTQIEIFNYQIEAQDKKHDTLMLHEAVFYELGDKLLKVKPKNDIKKIEVFYTLLETLNEWGNERNEAGVIPKWKGYQPYQKLEVVNQWFYRIPLINDENRREATAKRMKLKRSPHWDHIGEGWWVPMYLYEGLIVPYEISSAILKIVITDQNNETKTEFIEIGFSYGC